MLTVNPSLTLPRKQTLATFAPQQNGTQQSLIPAIPPHLQPQNSRNGAPQFATPPPGAYPITAPHAGPTAYPQYAAGPEGHSLPASHYGVSAPQQTTGQSMPAALAAIPEGQRVSRNFAIMEGSYLTARAGSCPKACQYEPRGDCRVATERTC